MHIEPILRKVNKEISILKNLRHTLPRKSFGEKLESVL